MLLSREEILSIEQYCKENNVLKQDYLKQIGVSGRRYYRSKARLRAEDENEVSTGIGSFIELPSKPGEIVPAAMPPKRTYNKSGRCGLSKTNNITIEIQTRSGNAMRIQGNLSSSHLRELIAIMKECNV